MLYFTQVWAPYTASKGKGHLHTQFDHIHSYDSPVKSSLFDFDFVAQLYWVLGHTTVSQGSKQHSLANNDIPIQYLSSHLLTHSFGQIRSWVVISL